MLHDKIYIVSRFEELEDMEKLMQRKTVISKISKTKQDTDVNAINDFENISHDVYKLREGVEDYVQILQDLSFKIKDNAYTLGKVVKGLI